MTLEKSLLGDALRTAVGKTFEGLAFVEFDEIKVVESLPEFNSSNRITSIQVRDPLKGNLILIWGESFCQETYESVTGEIFEPGQEEAIKDTLNELANTICGRFMASLVEEDMDFSLGIPNTSNFANIHFDDYLKVDPVTIEFTTMEEKIYCIYTPMND